MNRIVKLLSFFFLFSLPYFSKADVAIEGEVDIRVKVLNLSDFPGFEFFIEYQEYYYDMGWQAGDIVQVAIQEGQEFETGEKGGGSKLFAKDAQGNTYATEQDLGGNTVLDDYKASYIVQEINIKSVEGGKITFKVADEYKVYPDGKTRKLKKGFVLFGVNLFGVDLGLFVLPIVCLAGLIFFFWTRRNPVRA